MSPALLQQICDQNKLSKRFLETISFSLEISVNLNVRNKLEKE